MLNAYLYRVRRAALKRPWKFLLALLFAFVLVVMIGYPSLMSMPNSDGTMSSSYVPRDISVVTGGMYLILTVMFSFMFFTGLKNGVVGFSTADVNFHMAGPFTPRFNLIIAASGTLQMCMFITFMLATQTSLIYGATGVSSIDLIVIILGTFLSSCIGYFGGSYFGAVFSDDEAKKRSVTIISASVVILIAGGFVVSLVLGGAVFSDLGIKGTMSKLGESFLLKLLPGGWVSMIYDGIINGRWQVSIIGAVLTAFVTAVLFVIYRKGAFDYYDEAIAFAQKAADLAEQKRAGIDSDTAAMTKRAKVGSEKLGDGTGASAFTAIHFLMNKRGTRLFFVNPLSLMYRIITAVYLGFMASGSNEGGSLIISAFAMMIILNSIVYAGGKTVTEFTKPYIYLVPETSRRKLFACLKADLPEMAFDSVLCGILMYVLCGFSVVEALCFCVMMTVFDLLCEMAALLLLKLFPMLGKHLLMIVRYFGVMFVISIAAVPLAAVSAVTGSMTAGIISGAVAGAILLAILTPIASIVVERAEM